jgi:hypothetical protein
MDTDFEAYIRLLEDVGIDVSNARRIPEPGPRRRWLYAWQRKREAERFADELRRRTGDADWEVYQYEDASEERGPVAPLDIARIPEKDGYTYFLTPASRERVAAAFPGTRLPASLSFSMSVAQDFQREKGDEGWMEIARLLTRMADEEIDSLGGVRFIVGERKVAFQRIPTAA